MPYVIVETERTSGIKEILAVPQTWLVNKTQGVGYVHWPNVQKDEHFKALLANDRTLPHPEWKQRMCRILFRDMPSLPVAETMIRTLQMQSTIKARASSSNINFEKTAPPLLVESLPPPLIFIPKTDQQYQQSENVQELYSNVIPKQEDQEMEEEEKDPFGDDGPSLPPLQAISNEPAILDTGRKRLLQSSDEEEYDPLEDVSPLSSNPGLRVIGVEQLSSDAKRQFASFGTEQERLAGKTSVAVVKVEQLSAEVEHLFTSLGEEQEEESMQGDKASSQLFGLIRELKFMMINNQKEIKKIVSESMGKIHRTINLLVDRKDNKESDGGRDVFRIADLDEYKFEPLTTIEEAENFNERLKDEAYRKEIHDWIDSNVCFESSSQHRMHTMMDLIFDRHLFADFSWSGINNKHSMQVLSNVVQLFEYIGSSSVQRMKRQDVKDFFMRKLKQAKTRKNRNFVRKSAPRSRPLFTKHGVKSVARATADKVAKEQSSTPSLQMNVDDDRNSLVASVEQRKISEDLLEAQVQQPKTIASQPPSAVGNLRAIRINPTKSVTKMKGSEITLNYDLKLHKPDENEVEARQPGAGTSHPPATEENLPAINIYPIRSFAQIKAFEVTLNDEKRKKQVERWIDRTVGSITELNQRMKVLLERLIDKKFLLSFCWTNKNNTEKHSLAEFKNIVELFEYASKTKLHNTVIYNHAFVASFFIRTLDHVS